MTYLLDTDHISILQRERGAEFDLLMGRIAHHDLSEIAFSVISFHEQTLGCHTYILRAKDSPSIVRGYSMLSRVIRVFASAPVLPFDLAATRVFDEISGRRLRVPTMDLRIASIAVSRQMTLLTRNVRDFERIAELRTEDWTS